MNITSISLSNPLNKLLAMLMATMLIALAAIPSHALADEAQTNDFLRRLGLELSKNCKGVKPDGGICVCVQLPPNTDSFWLVIGPPHKEGHQ